jgi:hypothetical protein
VSLVFSFFNPDIGGGNSGMGIKSELLYLAWLICWGIYICLEAIKFFWRHNRKFGSINLMLLVVIIGVPVLLSYLNHLLN